MRRAICIVLHQQPVWLSVFDILEKLLFSSLFPETRGLIVIFPTCQTNIPKVWQLGKYGDHIFSLGPLKAILAHQLVQ